MFLKFGFLLVLMKQVVEFGGKSRFLRRVLCKRNTQYGSLFLLDFGGVVIFFLNSPLGFWFDEAGVRICEKIEVLSEKLFRALKKKRYML